MQTAQQSDPAADQRFVTRLTRSSGSNFYYSFLFLPRPQREAIHALYAFCREVDDSVDTAASPPEAEGRVAFWRGELAACYEGRATHPVTRSLEHHLARFPMRQEDLEEVIRGVAMDIAPRDYTTFEDLLVYCDRVASAVGLACIEIFGYTDPQARDYAVGLGRAFQMTNILRDVAFDARRGRFYLPTEDLQRFGCSAADLQASIPGSPYVDLMRFEVTRTRSLFQEAHRLLPAADRRSLFAAEIMGAIYESILHRIEKDPAAVLRGKISLSRTRKLALAARIYFKALTVPHKA